MFGLPLNAAVVGGIIILTIAIPMPSWLKIVIGIALILLGVGVLS